MPALTTDTRLLESRQPLPFLQTRQSSNGDIVAIPTVYQGLNSGPSPGVVVGIILGSIAGFLFFVWLLWMLSNGGGFIRANRDEEESVIVTRSHRKSSRSTRTRSRAPEMAAAPRRDRVYKTERIVRTGPPPRDQSRSRVRESHVLVDDFVVPPPPRERRVEGDDVVEVIEEHSDVAPPPRRKSKRDSGGNGYRRAQDSDLGY